MHNLGFALAGAWKVLLASVLLGAGLPILFALGVRALAYGAGGDAEPGVPGPPPRRIGTVTGYLLFGIVVLGVLLGIAYIVAGGFGKTLSFQHFHPAIVDK
ncbi:hypothetical protein ACFQFC_39080 [Amorphoplanes digitatis]|uniref:Transmembrane protein n=1 Tax=Actinoplanes digitatis TaxID=1868 RepID=A0A7W7HWQ0_9ACTN|nr:hypothetical protein [Actinoplanes digitatis]MBB4762174.1 hypothetical protein [Actinoplanes digitatis]GID96268.1 hypothetical protein Adi01nite_56800 [Actinoplanes digitatis]